MPTPLAAMADNLVVHPYHADGAGGLGAIGQHAAQCVYLLATVAAFIGLGTLLPFLRGLGTLQVTFWNPLTAILWALFLVFVPLFFALLVWPPHRAMCRARTLSPSASMASGGGPIQVSPAATTVRAKSAFSARKP